MNIKSVFIITFFMFVHTVTAQTDEPTQDQITKLEQFWKTFVNDVSKNNKDAVLSHILFPLDLECAIGTDKGISTQEFLENYAFFFPKERIKRMKKTTVKTLRWSINYSNLHKDVSKNSYIVSYDYKNGFGISMQFSEVNGIYKLVYFICSTP